MGSHDRIRSMPELIHFQTTDGLILPGLLYAPEHPSRTVALFLHGNGDTSVFYQARTNVFGQELCRRGVASFAFNNRGAYLIKKLRKSGPRRRSVRGGTAFERIRDCVKDIDGAIAMLRARGFRRFHLIGHSTGANKICVYDSLKKDNPIARYVLLGPGDDVGLYYRDLGPTRFQRAIERSLVMIKAGKRDDLVPPSLAPFSISYGSLLDTIDPDGRYNCFPFLDVMRELRLGRKRRFREFRAITRPVLVLIGENDEFCFDDARNCAGILRDHPPRGRSSIRIVDGADHGFHGMESEVGSAIAEWLVK